MYDYKSPNNNNNTIHINQSIEYNITKQSNSTHQFETVGFTTGNFSQFYEVCPQRICPVIHIEREKLRYDDGIGKIWTTQSEYIIYTYIYINILHTYKVSIFIYIYIYI